MWLYMLDINFNQIIEMIEKRKNNAYRKVNEEMILLYLEVGKFLYELKENSNYGDKVTTKASDFMKNNYPNIKGFTKRNYEDSINRNYDKLYILNDKETLEDVLKKYYLIKRGD